MDKGTTSEEKDLALSYNKYNVLRGPAMKDKGPVKEFGPKKVTHVGLSPVEGHKIIAQVEGPSGGQKLI